MANGGGHWRHLSVASNLLGASHLPEEGRTLQPTMSPPTPATEPQSPKDDDKCTTPPPPPTVTSAVNWRMEALESLEMPKREADGETAVHTRAPGYRHIALSNPWPPARGAPRQRTGARRTPSCPGPQAPPCPGRARGPECFSQRLLPSPSELMQPHREIQHFLRHRERHRFANGLT